MALGFLTLAQIITQGLQQGGNPGLATIPAGYTESIALTFCKSFLHHIFLNYDFPIQLKWGTFTTGTGADGTYAVSLAGLTRYRSVKMIKLDTIHEPLTQKLDIADIYTKILSDQDSSPVPTGKPYEYAAKDKTQLYVYPIPDVTYTGKILYYSMPDVAGYTTSTVVEFEDTYALINAVAFFARDYDKDSIMNLTGSIAKQLFGEYRVAVEDVGRDTVNQLQLSKQFFKYRRGD